MVQKIKDYIRNNKYILRWVAISFLTVFLLTFFAYFNDGSKNGVYPGREFGTLKEFKKSLNPYINIYTIKQLKSDNREFSNKVEQVGFGFISTDNNSGGVIVVMVVSGSVSEKAGLKIGDIIQKADGVDILKDKQLGELIDSKNSTQLEVKRTDQTYSIFLTKSPFIIEEGLKVGSSVWAPKSEGILDSNTVDQARYGLDELKKGINEYSVEGISFLGAILIAFLWGLIMFPVFIIGILLYKLFSKIRYKIFIFLINLILIPIIMSGTMFLVYQSNFFDEMFRNSTDTGGGFIDLSILIYPLAAFILSIFLIIGYTITLFVYKKYIKKISDFNNKI